MLDQIVRNVTGHCSVDLRRHASQLETGDDLFIDHERPGLDASGLVIQPSVLLDSMIEMFEALWLRAVPLHLDGRAVPDVDPQVVEIVRLLASGLTDAGIARHLKVSERTVGRRVVDALEVLGAASRVQLGILAERRG